ncbi:ABC transporter ATP-binding protein [Pararhodobacter sp.]|uniref:ABC transporter ATP-binding protein n=1 Tax=Pararhodobacter sp. TaxID=2127056 RepID=UPI002FDE5DCB
MTAAKEQDVVLEVENLSVSLHGGPEIVSGINFKVHAGETLCIVGESGSGKSVTSLAVMQILDAAALRASSGSIRLEGVDLLKASPAKLRSLRAARMSMIFQEPMTALNPVERIGDQVLEVLDIHNDGDRRGRHERVLEMFRSVKLPDPERIFSSYPHELSGGQRQRVVIAMALILRPRLLIADEPTTALDVTTQAQILHLISELQREMCTAVLFITHDFGVVHDIADRILVMNKGHVVEEGARLDILTRPKDDYTRMLISSVPSLVPVPPRDMAEDLVLEVAGMAKQYTIGSFGKRRQLNALHPTDFSLRKGEILGVVGESGSGKTTLARCVARLVKASAGSVRLVGTDIASLSAAKMRSARRDVQIVFQDPYRSMNARMKLRDVIAEGMVNFGVPAAEIRRRCVELIEAVGLQAAMLDRYPHQLSGGQRQRICIARALALDPSVLICDEAVSALDVSVQAQVIRLLLDLRDRLGVSILFITHDLRVAAQLCDSVIVMHNGQVVEAGRAVDILTTPEHEYTRYLIDAVPARGWNFQERVA